MYSLLYHILKGGKKKINKSCHQNAPTMSFAIGYIATATPCAPLIHRHFSLGA